MSFPSSFGLSYNNLFGSGGGTYTYIHDPAQSVTGSEFYELYTAPTGGTLHGAGYGIEFRKVGTETWVYVESDDNTLQPYGVSVNSGATGASARIFQANDVVRLDNNVSGGSTYYATFNVTAGMLWTAGGNPIGGLSINPLIQNLVFTKISDDSINVKFDWENLDTFQMYNKRAGVIQSTTSSLGGASSGTVNQTFFIACQEDDECWIVGDYNNQSQYWHPEGIGSVINPYIFKLLSWSTHRKSLSVSTFLYNTGLTNDADFRIDLPATGTFDRLAYINYDATLQTTTIDPYIPGSTYYVYDRSTGNDYGSRFVAPSFNIGRVSSNFW